MMDKIEQLKSFLSKSPNDSFLQHALALEYIKINELTKARESFENLLINNPDYIGSYYHLAKLYQQLQEKQLAIKTYEEGMKRAKTKNENHAYNELLSAYEEYVDE